MKPSLFEFFSFHCAVKGVAFLVFISVFPFFLCVYLWLSFLSSNKVGGGDLLSTGPRFERCLVSEPKNR